ncbi:PREDICTED: protein SMG8 [Rhagoletis zephyria]|uniref:protein SMG8 n=1 Tax=Rhagoletis zephyria TaxID=28612 RepID=UPI00081152D7|nr:PREDICTED: protein SMG8 [Rhagoletis zephyria]XP_036329195.1 protein SMG8 [Rhagoletis pomonella]
MPEYQSWTFPHIPAELAELLFQNDEKLVVVGVIGKSAFSDSNKMVAMGVLDSHPSLLDHQPQEGTIRLYYNRKKSMLLLHFETTFDAACMQKMLEEELAEDAYGHFLLFNQRVRNRFARMLLFATQVCHIIVFVELSVTFDASLLMIFRALKIIRDKYILKFLPKLVKNSSTGTFLGKSARLCSPRVLFLFENYPDGYEKTSECISKLEFEVEDSIYKMLRNEFIITNNSAMSLFSIPSNKRFVYYNTDPSLREDPLLKSITMLQSFLQKSNFKEDDEDDLEDLRPFKGFGKPLIQCNPERTQPTVEEMFLKKRNFMDLLMDHVDEALQIGFDDSSTKFKGKNHFVILPAKAWYETFKMLHRIFIENPDNPKFEANDADYKAYLENFNKIMDIDDEFFNACCDIGLQKAYAMYNNPTLTHYSSTVHKKLVEEAVSLYMKYARGTQTVINETKLREMCERCWRNGKQQCEMPSLRGNPCVLPKHIVKEPSEHSSAHVFISTCNCGRTQGRREDPYTMKHANYEFYEYMANNCNLCAKVKKVHFPVFEPSINDYRAAEFEIAFPKLSIHDSIDFAERHDLRSPDSIDSDECSQPLTASQGTHTNLSLVSTDELDKIAVDDGDMHSSEESLNELVIQVKDKDAQKEEEKERSIYRQPSTTEYLPGMVHTESPLGLLPRFPSWSLVCVGPSSVYSHNTGLLEHFQSGFLSGANFLLPWDVHVRLEHSASWAYEKTRLRKMGEVFILKIFVGCEYECPRGHRFMMNSPDKVLRGGSGILRDSGSKIVYNNMPLYFPCPCRSHKADVAQLMRVHVVTPKAPVNVILDPRVRTGERDYIFTMGLPNPPKLTQSAYWILRLPYVYQGDEGPIAPPTEITATSAINYGCLLAGMFGVSETEVDD